MIRIFDTTLKRRMKKIHSLVVMLIMLHYQLTLRPIKKSEQHENGKKKKEQQLAASGHPMEATATIVMKKEVYAHLCTCVDRGNGNMH